jgi:uncharacterized protein YcbK (DUF882 family)
MMIQRMIAVAIGIAFVMSSAAAEAKSRGKRTHVKTSYSQHHVRHHSRHARVHGKRSRIRHAHIGRRGGATADRSCLTSAARGLLARIEARFGAVQVISTCRPGAVVAGTGHPSKHRYGMAFDFRTANKAAVVRWLAESNSGGTMTYAHADHIHADVGSHFVSLAGHRSRAFASRGTRRAYASAGFQRPAADLAGGSGYSDGAPMATPRVAMRGPRYGSRVYADGQQVVDGQQMVMYRPTRRGQVHGHVRHHVRHAHYLGVPAHPQGPQRPVHAPI